MIPTDEVVDVRQPPGQPIGRVAELWKPVEGTNKIMCTACARYCKIGEGQVGLCGIRGVHEGKLWLYVYGRVITGHVDPIEKKPVQHYRPGSKIFSIATTGCNWLCHPAGTEILIADGSTKPVEAISAGEVLWSVSPRGDPLPSIVSGGGSRRAPSYRVRFRGSAPDLLATAEHPIYTARGWRALRDLSRGDAVLAVTGEARGGERPGASDGVLDHAVATHPEALARLRRALHGPPDPRPMFHWREVKSVMREDEGEPVFSFECVPFHNYVADGAVVHNCRYCFAPGTRVLTDEGHVPIETLFERGDPTSNPEARDVGDREVLTHKGRW